MNPAKKAAITLVLGCCVNELSIREPTRHFGPNGAHQSSIEIAVDQRQHIGKARQIGAEFFSIFKRMAPFVQVDIERFIRRVNSQTKTNDQEWCTVARTRALPPGASECEFPAQLADRARPQI
jgi:hypothetical protein